MSNAYMKGFRWEKGADGAESFARFTEGTALDYRPCDGLVWINNYLSNLFDEEGCLLDDDALRGDNGRELCRFLAEGLLAAAKEG